MNLYSAQCQPVAETEALNLSDRQTHLFDFLDACMLYLNYMYITNEFHL